MTPRERFFATIQGQSVDRPPVTPIVMQWAADLIGRSFHDYYLEGEVLAEGQIAAARTLGSDWVSVMSDPWCESCAYGMTFDWPETSVGVPHCLLIESPADARKLPAMDLDNFRIRERLVCIDREVREVGGTHPVAGWVEGPIAQYADLRGLEGALMDLMDDPATFEAAAEHLVHEALRLVKVQVEHGASVIGVGDAAASVIGPTLYREHVLRWEKLLFKGIHDAGAAVKLHICGDITPMLPDMIGLGADVIDLDWMVSIAAARKLMPAQTFAGNFNPATVLLRGTPEQVAAEASRCYAESGGHHFMLQAGCETPPGTPLANVLAFCPGKN